MPISTVGKVTESYNQCGFTYVMVLAGVVIMAVMASMAQIQLSYVIKRENEAELLFRGIAIRNAIRSYYESGKPVKTFPRTLEDLVKDPRLAHKKHLRKLYIDPISRLPWRVIKATDGGIAGVASISESVPLKSGNFPQGLEHFEKANTYGEWTFVYEPMSAIRAVTSLNPVSK